MATNWSPNGVPKSADAAEVDSGEADITANVGRIASLTIGGSGTVEVASTANAGGAALRISGALTNANVLYVGNATLSAPVTVSAASISNSGIVHVNGSATKQALVNISGAAGFGTAGVLTGFVTLGTNSVIQFGSGQLTSIAANGLLDFGGPGASIQIAGQAANSAVAGLANVDGILDVQGGSLTTATGLTISATGQLEVQAKSQGGASTATIGGAISNGGFIQVLGGNSSQTINSLTAGSISQTTGSLNVTGTAANPAAVYLSGAAGFGTAGVVTGNVSLDSNATIQFGSGQISSIASGASLALSNVGTSIQDSGQGVNSALALSSVSGTLSLNYGVSLTTPGGLTNTGEIDVDTISFAGNSRLKITGTLTNSGLLFIGADDNTNTAQTTVSAAALNNADSGAIIVDGGTSAQALLNVGGAAGFGTARVLTGDVELSGNGVIKFASSSLTTIAANANLSLIGAQASIQSGAATGNTALKSLNAVDGALNLEDGATILTTGSLANRGDIEIDTFDGAGNSALLIGNILTNYGSIEVGATDGSLAVTDILGATSLVNRSGATMSFSGSDATNRVDVTGAMTNLGSVAASNTLFTGNFVNNGTLQAGKLIPTGGQSTGIVGNSGIVKINGVLSGTGTATIVATYLDIMGANSSGNVAFGQGNPVLELDHSASFSGQISGFGSNDAMDLRDLTYMASDFYNYSANSTNTGGTLTIFDGSTTARLTMVGSYTNASFHLSDDGSGKVFVTDPQQASASAKTSNVSNQATAAAAPAHNAHMSDFAHALFNAAFAPAATSDALVKAPDAYGAHATLAAFVEPVHR